MTKSFASPGRVTKGSPVQEVTITASIVSDLVRSQFPQWAHLPVSPVELDGWDNRTFRLGDTMSVRLPSDDVYVPQVQKEQRWLPILAPRLPLPIPVPLAAGQPGHGFPRPWSVYRWLPGEPAAVERPASLVKFASELADFLVALHHVDPADGPPPGRQNFWRGGPLVHYDAETREAIAVLEHEINMSGALGAWDAALASTWARPPVWLHGDVAPSNLLVNHGQLGAVLDFGSSAVGDPACDLAIAWTFFSGNARSAFRSHVRMDDETWIRGAGWALWKALVTITYGGERQPDDGARLARRFGWSWPPHQVINEILNEMP